VILLASILAIFIMALFFNQTTSIIDSAEQLKLTPEELPEGWKEEQFVYLDNPVNFFETIVDHTEENAPNKNESEKDRQRFQELSTKLEELNVNNGAIQFLRKEVNGGTRGFIEIDMFVFDDGDFAKEYYNYENGRYKGSEIHGLGDEASRYSDNPHASVRYLLRVSNAVFKIIVFKGEEEESRAIAERLVAKAES
jgi:hypothetical protein